MNNSNSRRLLAAGAVIAAGTAVSSVQAVPIFALTDNNSLLAFDSATPSVLNGVGPILDTNNNQIQDLIGIDFRPTTGVLYGVGSGGGIYTINTANARATQVGTLAADPGDLGGDPPFVQLSGSRFAFDFNPVPDQAGNPSLRIISNTRQNLRVNVTNGLTTTDTLPSGNIVGAGYTNNDTDPGTGSSLYGIDSVTDQLVLFSNPNTGAFANVGLLTSIDASSLMGFDIFYDGVTNFGFAALQDASNGVSRFYTITLGTGAASLVGTIEGGDRIDGLAVAPIPEPASLAFGGALFGLLACRRRS